MTENERFASVLAVAGNYAVIKLDTRNFPASAIQGDSLKILQGTLKEITENLDAGDVDEARLCLTSVESVIADMLAVYESASREQGFELPYYIPE
ncbi:DUF6959 family protein [Streptomyces sp. NPDC101733]|uniref:DUF6959 family protein n=1 Tax=unclassified Streptomyces TaxID=2593676 RepID=UPI003807D485